MKPTNEQLVARFQAGDEDAMAELLEQNKGLACRVIFRLRHLAEQECMEDLEQVANKAIWTAAVRFDASRGFKFTTLAYHCMMNAVRLEVDQHATMPKNTQNDYYREEKKQARNIFWIDDIGQHGTPFDLADHRSGEAEHATEHGEELQLLRWAMTRLPERRRSVLLSRLAGHTLDEVGKQIGITKERVRQIELEAKAATTALVRAQAGMPATKKFTKEERTYIRLVRLTRPVEEIANDLRRSVDAVARLVGSKKWAGRKQAAM